MSAIEYLALWAIAIAFGGIGDWLWLTYARPVLAARFGWRPVARDERIPPAAWLGAMGVVAVIGFWSYAGALVGLS